MKQTTKKVLLAGVALGMLQAGLASADTITFEDLMTGQDTKSDNTVVGAYGKVKNVALNGEYDNLIWSGWNAQDTWSQGNGGYADSASSGQVVVMNPYGKSTSISALDGETIDVDGAWFTAAWNDDLNLNITGLDDEGNQLYSKDVTLSATEKLWVDMDFTGVSTLQFVSSGGTDHGYNKGRGTHFAMDDLTYSVNSSSAGSEVPEPATMALFGLGLAGVGFMARRRQTK